MLCRVSSFSLGNTTQAGLLYVLPACLILDSYFQNLLENHCSWRHFLFFSMKSEMLEITTAQQRHQYENTIYALGLTVSSLAGWIMKAYFKHRKHGKRRYKAKRWKGASSRAEMQSSGITSCLQMRENSLYN